MDLAAPLPRLNEYIESELDRLEGFTKEPLAGSPHMDAANDLFRCLVGSAWEPDGALQPTAAGGRS
jgi:hypothetical protein